MEVQRALLADYAIPITQRVPAKVDWDNALVAETLVAVREVLTTIETSPAERVDAAAALAELSSRLVPEAANALEHFCLAGNRSAFRALAKLGGLDGKWWQHARDTAMRKVVDESLSPRERHYAADVVGEIDPKPGPDVFSFLRETASDERTSALSRADALFTLRHTDGLGPLRALRDDKRALPATRRRAATRLLDYTVEDRAKSAQVLNLIATDIDVRPALR